MFQHLCFRKAKQKLLLVSSSPQHFSPFWVAEAGESVEPRFQLCRARWQSEQGAHCRAWHHHLSLPLPLVDFQFLQPAGVSETWVCSAAVRGPLSPNPSRLSAASWCRSTHGVWSCMAIHSLRFNPHCKGFSPFRDKEWNWSTMLSQALH